MKREIKIPKADNFVLNEKGTILVSPQGGWKPVPHKESEDFFNNPPPKKDKKHR